jgi:hypothetical protein
VVAAGSLVAALVAVAGLVAGCGAADGGGWTRPAAQVSRSRVSIPIQGGPGIGGSAAPSTLTAAPGDPDIGGSDQPTPVAPPPGTPVGIGPMRVVLPTGAGYIADQSADLGGCVSVTGSACMVRLTDMSLVLQPGAQVNVPSVDRDFGWYIGTDVPSCVLGSSEAATTATGSKRLETRLAPVGPKRAEYARWRESCADPVLDNDVRMWWLPTSKVLITEYGATPEHDAAVDAMLAAAVFVP